jgi:hypothetical protein
VPRGRRIRLSTTDAQDVLQELIRDGRISTADVNRYREIRELEQRLAALRGGGGRRRAVAPQRGGVGRRSSRITAEQRASRQLQGRYLGLIRQIPASQRGRYAKIAKNRGREAAIKEMQSTLNK